MIQQAAVTRGLAWHSGAYPVLHDRRPALAVEALLRIDFLLDSFEYRIA